MMRELSLLFTTQPALLYAAGALLGLIVGSFLKGLSVTVPLAPTLKRWGLLVDLSLSGPKTPNSARPQPLANRFQ